jgi:hypothetical protein
MIEIERLGDLRTDRRCRRELHADGPITLVSIEAAEEENIKGVRGHLTTRYAAPGSLSKKYRANQVSSR